MVLPEAFLALTTLNDDLDASGVLRAPTPSTESIGVVGRIL
jgi:hypothetical protein